MRQKLGLFLGVVFFVTILNVPPIPGMSTVAKMTAAIAVLMATWWITEAIPISVWQWLH